LRDRRAVNGARARRLLAQARHQQQQARLAAAAWPDNDDETPRLDVERDVRQRDDVLRRGLEDLPDTADFNRAGPRDGLDRRYVRQWLHRVSTHRTSSLKAIAIVAIITTPANSCFIWKFSPQLAI